MDKSITYQLLQQIEEIKTEICDKYCRYPFEWSIDDEETLKDKYCKDCPLTRL